MSYATQPAFIHRGDWDDKTRAHPAMNWMEKYTNAYDSGEIWKVPSGDWHTGDPTFVKPDGSTYTGGKEFLAKTQEMYGPFTKFTHTPYFLACVDTDYGWEMIGQATVYANLPGERGAEEPPQVTDQRGQKWDVAVPGAFRFQYVKNPNAKHNGISLRRTEIMSESLPIVMTLVKRGVISLG